MQLQPDDVHIRVGTRQLVAETTAPAANLKAKRFGGAPPLGKILPPSALRRGFGIQNQVRHGKKLLLAAGYVSQTHFNSFLILIKHSN
jgi:hypothetical protein